MSLTLKVYFGIRYPDVALGFILAAGASAILDKIRHGWRSPPMNMRDPVQALVFAGTYLALHIAMAFIPDPIP